MSLNIAALNALPPAQQTRSNASLLILSSGATLSFLYNPSTRSVNTSAVYASAPTFGVAVPEQIFQHANGRVLQLDNLIIDTYNSRKSAQPLLDSYINLTKSREEVQFIWSSYVFGPAVVTNVSWDESMFLEGQPAKAVVNLTLQEVPDTLSGDEAPPDTTYTQAPLTNRQTEKGVEVVDQFLTDNNFRLRNILQSTTNDSLSISRDGIVARGAELLGNWDGFTFNPADFLT